MYRILLSDGPEAVPSCTEYYCQTVLKQYHHYSVKINEILTTAVTEICLPKKMIYKLNNSEVVDYGWAGYRIYLVNLISGVSLVVT